MKNILSIAIVLLAFCVNINAAETKEDNRELIIYSNIKDHITHEGLDSTLTAKILRAADSSFVDTMEVNSYEWDGKRYCSVQGKIKKAGDYLLRFEAPAYETKYVELKLPKLYKREKYMELKNVFLKKRKMGMEGELDELVVTATKLKFYMDGDTLVYNADAFNLAEGSMMGALIKKLPGVEVSKGGEITVNGKKVETLLLNGKDFFNEDRELMLENMPAYMVKSIQSYERVPENVKGTNQEKSTPKELVMNVKLKRQYNSGWLNNIEGGWGTTFFKNDQGRHENKFMGRLFSLRFSDRSRFMMYANVNNLNDDRTPGEKGEWSPLTQSQGLTETYKAGADYAVGSWEKKRYHGSANVSYKEKDDATHTNRESFLEGGNTFGRSLYGKKSYDTSLDTQHEFMYRTTEGGKWYKHIYFWTSPVVRYLKWNNYTQTASATLEQNVAEQWGKAWMDSISAPNAGELLKRYAITRTLNRTKGVGHYTAVNENTHFTYSPAHNDLFDFSMGIIYSMTDRKENTFEHYTIDRPKMGQMDFRNEYRPTYDFNQSFTITPRLAVSLNNDVKKLHTIDFRYSYNNRKQVSNNSLYLLSKQAEWAAGTPHQLGMLPSVEEQQQTMDHDNSGFMHYYVNTHTPELSYRITKNSEDEFNAIIISSSLPLQSEKMNVWQGHQADTVRNTAFLQYGLNFFKENWKRGRSIRAQYNARSYAPGLLSMMNLTNTSNPLYISLTNPHLKKTTDHTLNASYRDKFGRGTLFNVWTDISITKNAVASSRIYNRETGVTITKPENINGNWFAQINANVDVPLDTLEKWRLKNNISYNYTHSADLNSDMANYNGSSVRSVVQNNIIGETIELTYRRSSKLEVSAKGRVNYQHSTSDRQGFMTIKAWDFNYGLAAQIELPWNMQLSTDITMYSRRGYSDSSMNTNEFVWNARLTKRMMKGNLLIHFDGFDLLGNLSNVRRSVNAQGRTETFYNVIPSYGLLHVAWKINNKPKKK